MTIKTYYEKVNDFKETMVETRKNDENFLTNEPDIT